MNAVYVRRAAALLAAAVLPVAPVYAEVEEITVSAQRRDADMQTVPISVSAFSADDMTKLQMEATVDIAAGVPNMQTYNVTANGAAMQLFMRGTGVQNPGFNASESPVGLYLDDVYRGRLATANLDLTDVERTEVLRGPQGTLYGRNTLAGAVKFITRTPGDETYGNAALSYGNFETTKFTAAVGGPLVENQLAGSLALLYHDRGEGWIERGNLDGNPTNEKRDPLGEFTNVALRGKLHWYAGDVFDAVFSLGLVDVENDGYNGIPYDGNPGSPAQGDFYATQVSNANAGRGETDQINTSLNLTWNFDDWAFKSITGYSDIDDEFGFDLFGGYSAQFGAPASLYVNSSSNAKTFTQEFNFSGDAQNDSFHWIAGLYYLNEKGDQLYNPTFLTEDVRTKTVSYALFGEGTWDITDKFSFTLGGRLTRDEKEYENTCTGVCNDVPSTWTVDLEDSFNEFTPRVIAEYQATDSMLLWASWSQGFQAGGYQTLCFGSETCAQNVYKPQTVNSTEVGIKTDFFNNTLRFNTSIWYAQYADIQLTAVANDGSFPVLNVGDVDVIGMDLETYWAPTDSFTAFLIFGAAAEDLGSGVANTVGSDRLPGLPEKTARFGFDWTSPLAFGNDWNLLLGANVEYSDEYLAAITQIPADQIIIDSFTRWNGYIGIRQPDGGWSAIFSGTNLSDSEDNFSGLLSTAPPQFGGGFNIRTPQPPREVRFEVAYNF